MIILIIDIVNDDIFVYLLLLLVILLLFIDAYLYNKSVAKSGNEEKKINKIAFTHKHNNNIIKINYFFVNCF